MATSVPLILEPRSGVCVPRLSSSVRRLARPGGGDPDAPPQPSSTDAALTAWVGRIAALTQPDRIVWCEGSLAEAHQLASEAVAAGSLIKLNPEWRPGSYLARTDPRDVARVEARTFVCTTYEEDAGPNNNWRDPKAMRAELDRCFAGSMRGRTLYVVPFSMGPVGGAISQLGVQITDSAYVVLSLQIMTRVTPQVYRLIEAGVPWVPLVHSVGYPLVDANGEARVDVAWPCNDEKYIVHFPDSREAWSYGSGYGGNAILPKKSFALRLASVMARDEGWLAEHMLLIRITSPEGRKYHVAAAFPSASGKTNLAMLRPTITGWQVETLGDDIVWMRPGEDGRLWAINPEQGFFGVAPGTGERTNPVALDTIWGNTLFTNVALRPDGDVWWEGMTQTPPNGLVDWRGESWSPASGSPAAHPNSRFCVRIDQCPSLSDDWDSPAGVPLDAIIFGGRRRRTIPLVVQARSWKHGVFMGATMASEQTAAAEGMVGELRHDPFAMLPFCGYNMADYWRHWLKVGRGLGRTAPQIFQVNWFRRSEAGEYLWPGFGDNARVLAWMIRRLEGQAAARDTEIGWVPSPDDIDVTGLDIDRQTLSALLSVDRAEWLTEANATEEYFAQYAGRVPAALNAELASLRYRLGH